MVPKYLWLYVIIVLSAASRCILVPFEWYGHPKMCTQKALVTLFLFIFHVKSKWNIVCEYLKTKIFSRDTVIFPEMHWTSNIFRPSATTIGGFGVSLIYPILNLKKTVCPKKVWMRHWYVASLIYLTVAKREGMVLNKFDLKKTPFPPLKKKRI